MANGWKPQASDFVVLVLGQSGSGKSTFINALVGWEAAQVNDQLHSNCVSILPTPHPNDPEFSKIPCVNGRRLVFVEVPGFNNFHFTDNEIWHLVRSWVSRWYGPRRPVDSVIFLHDISQARLPVADYLAAEHFIPILGHGHFNNVQFITTQPPDPPSSSVIAERTKELREDFLERSIEAGARLEGLPKWEDSRKLFIRLLSSIPQTVDQPVPMKSCVILLLGTTGSGKSSFINHLMKKLVHLVGTSMESCTQTVDSVTYVHRDLPQWLIHVVDTPGFNNSVLENSDTLIWQSICQWLRLHRSSVFGGILYFENDDLPTSADSMRLRLAGHEVTGSRMEMIKLASSTRGSKPMTMDDASERLKSMVERADTTVTVASIRKDLTSLTPPVRERRSDFWTWLLVSFSRFFS